MDKEAVRRLDREIGQRGHGGWARSLEKGQGGWRRGLDKKAGSWIRKLVGKCFEIEVP